MHWFPAILWAGIIFFLSSLTSVGLPPFPYADKLIHAGIYTVLGFLVARALRKGHKLDFAPVVAATICFIAFYGVSDEVHQMYVPGRTAEVGDLLSDLVGGLAGVMFYEFFSRISKKN